MKLTINVFLLKAGRTVNDALSTELGLAPIQFLLSEVDCLFYHEQTSSRPKWTQLFSNIEVVDQLNLRGRSIKALLVMAVRERVFCFTFGHARHLIDGMGIERYFGLRTALSLTDPLLIKSVEKSNIDRTPLRSKSQSSKHLSIAEFDFKFDSEILKSLTGVVQGEGDESQHVSGSDSLALHSDVRLEEFPEIAARLLDAYEDERCKEKYPWMDYIVPVRDAEVIARLDELLVEGLNAEDFDRIRAAPPILIPDDINGFGYLKHRAGSKNGPTITFDLDLSHALHDKGILGAVSLQQLHSERIYLYCNGDDHQRETWSLYTCLEAEVELDGKVYLLSESDWYQIDRDYTESVNRYFQDATLCELPFPPYATDHEGTYLRRIGNNEDFYVLDQRLIWLTGASSGFEFCDLLTPENHIIHVKKYSSSSVLSHLFSQAYVSAEALINSPEVTIKVNERLAEIGCEHEFSFDSAVLPRNKVVFAIMQTNERLHMPFFSKVNFRQYSQRLSAMGYQVEICRIPSIEAA